MSAWRAMQVRRRAVRGRGAAGRQAGYSLIEVGIALAVIGLVAGGSILPLGKLLREKFVVRANEQVAASVDAVIGYALNNRTPGLTHVYGDTFSNTNTSAMRRYGYRVAHIPPGRPYLPCPDTDGDGYENRRPLNMPSAGTFIPQAQELARGRPVRFDATLGERMGTVADLEDVEFDAMQTTRAGVARQNFGGCERYHGALPWRTLGLRETDPWGMRLTYVVNPHFAVAGFGFDQETRAVGWFAYAETGAIEKVSATPGMTVGIRVPVAYGEKQTGDVIGFEPLLPCVVNSRTDSSNNIPRDIVDCSQSHRTPANHRKSFDVGSVNFYGLAPGGGNLDPAAFVGLTQSPDPYVGGFHYYDGVSNDISSSKLRATTDGLPFVVISHGANRRYAQFANGGCYVHPDDVDVVDTKSHLELFNAKYNNCEEAGYSFPAAVPGGVNVFRPGLVSSAEDGSYYKQVVFAVKRLAPLGASPSTPDGAHGVHVPTDIEDFDDIVSWLTRRELAARLRREGLFPLAETFRGMDMGHVYYDALK